MMMIDGYASILNPFSVGGRLIFSPLVDGRVKVYWKVVYPISKLETRWHQVTKLLSGLCHWGHQAQAPRMGALFLFLHKSLEYLLLPPHDCYCPSGLKIFMGPM